MQARGVGLQPLSECVQPLRGIGLQPLRRGGLQSLRGLGVQPLRRLGLQSLRGGDGLGLQPVQSLRGREALCVRDGRQSD